MATKAIAYDKVISPQNYLQLVTGKCFIADNSNQLYQVEKILEQEGYDNLWNYPLDEIDEVLEHFKNDGTRCVLVEIVNINHKYEQEKLYRWYELPFDHDVTDKDFE